MACEYMEYFVYKVTHDSPKVLAWEVVKGELSNRLCFWLVFPSIRTIVLYDF